MQLGQYIWQKKSWPNLVWNNNDIVELLAQARKAQGKILAQAVLVGLETQASFISEEVYTTSAIEGENLDKSSVRSSVARRLGLSTAGLPPEQRHIQGLVDMILDATKNFKSPLNQTRLFGWHAALFPTGFSGIHKITVGNWRKSKEPMRVISGSQDKIKIHFVAPPSKKLKNEMTLFFTWWKTAKLDGILRAAVSHFWFVTIHPFDDGNGRIARAITDLALAQDEQTGCRLYSLSTQIIKERQAYYDILSNCQKKDVDITAWIKWFLQMYIRAIEQSQKLIDTVLISTRFWQHYSHIGINDRQRKVLQKILDAGPDGFVGNMTNKKYVSITKTSRESAKRDLTDLEEKGILERAGQGRSLSYKLKFPT